MNEEIPIVNASERAAYVRTRLYRMWAGPYGTAGYVWEEHLDSAREVWVEYLDETAPGLLVSHEQLQEALEDASKERGFTWAQVCDETHEASEHMEAVLQDAETDMTIAGHASLKNGVGMLSYEWGGDEIDPGTPEYSDACYRSLQEGLEADLADIAHDRGRE